MRNEMDVVLTFKTPMLGTVPKDTDVYAAYILSKARELAQDEAEQELETVQEIEEKGWTGFHQDENGIFVYSYMVKGFLKSALEVLMTTKDIKKISAYKKWMDKLLFIEPRKLHFGLQEADGIEERPLRAMTAQGPRVSLARSDRVDEGRKLKCKIVWLDNDKGLTKDVIEKCLAYGEYVGLGQWRGSGGFGQFGYDVTVL
jgi:hypothetical protein